jgi:hypothetical protein
VKSAAREASSQHPGRAPRNLLQLIPRKWFVDVPAHDIASLEYSRHPAPKQRFIVLKLRSERKLISE